MSGGNRNQEDDEDLKTDTEIFLFGEEQTCLLCDRVFTYMDIGTLECRYHPGDYVEVDFNYHVKTEKEMSNPDIKDPALDRTIAERRKKGTFSIKHYTCCNATNDPRDRTHYEYTMPKGCVPMDHVSTSEELRRLVRHPYTLIPEQMAQQNLTVVKHKELYPNSTMYFHTHAQFSEFKGLVVPIFNKWKMSKTTEIEVDINGEYYEMLEKYKLVDESEIRMAKVAKEEPEFLKTSRLWIKEINQKRHLGGYDQHDISNLEQEEKELFEQGVEEFTRAEEEVDYKYSRNSNSYYSGYEAEYEDPSRLVPLDDGDDGESENNNNRYNKIEAHPTSKTEKKRPVSKSTLTDIKPFYVVRRMGHKKDAHKLAEVKKEKKKMSEKEHRSKGSKSSSKGTTDSGTSTTEESGSDGFRFAFGKIQDKFAYSEIPESTNEKVARMIDKLGHEYVKTFVWSVNAADTKSYKPPSGFSVVFEPNAPVSTEFFDNDKLLSGTYLIALSPNARFKNSKDLISDDTIIRNRERILELENKYISEASSKPFTRKVYDIGSYPSDADTWTPSMGKSGSYIGLFSSDENSGYTRKKRYWIGIQSHFVSGSNELFRILEEAESGDGFGNSVTKNRHTGDAYVPTLQGVLSNSPEISFIYGALERNVKRLGAQMIEALGIEGMPLEMDTYSAEYSTNNNGNGNTKSNNNLTPSIISCGLHKTPLNSFSYRKKHKTGGVVYHSNTINPSRVKNGIIVNQNPYLGPVILKGPTSTNHNLEFGDSWEHSKKSYGAFPVCTGRDISHKELSNTIKSRLDLNENEIGNLFPEGYNTHSATFTWEKNVSNNNIGSNSDGSKRQSVPNINKRLIHGVYKIRDVVFKEKERALGYQHVWGELPLRPLAVKISSS